MTSMTGATTLDWLVAIRSSSGSSQPTDTQTVRHKQTEKDRHVHTEGQTDKQTESIPKAYLFYLFISFSTDTDNTSNTNKNNKMPVKDRKAPEGTLTSTLINTI